MKIIYVLVVLVLSVNECRADGFKIKGRIVGGGEGVKVFLTDLSQYRHIYDSTVIKNGEFELAGGLIRLKCVVSRFTKMMTSGGIGKVR